MRIKRLDICPKAMEKQEVVFSSEYNSYNFIIKTSIQLYPIKNAPKRAEQEAEGTAENTCCN